MLRINLRETLIGNRGSEDSDETPVIEIGVKVLSRKSGPGNLVLTRGRAGGGVIRNMILRTKRTLLVVNPLGRSCITIWFVGIGVDTHDDGSGIKY